MLSYQHSFHAGNHADVIKHLCLIALIKNLNKKPKPFFYLDTHAGNGAYTTAPFSNKDPLLAKSVCDFVTKANEAKTQETNKQSTDRLHADCLAKDLLSLYADIVLPYLNKDLYLGSPLIANEAISRFKSELSTAKGLNNLHLSEMHPQAFDELKHWTNNTAFSVHKRDGFELLNALLPPKPNRGLVLIDPPYEQAQEYNTVVDAITNSLAKWPQGIIALWFPLLSSTRIDRDSGELAENPKSGLSETMLIKLAALAEHHKLGAVELRFVPHVPSEQTGMYGSGMFVLNPPWQFSDMMEKELKTLFLAFSQAECQELSFVKTWRESE